INATNPLASLGPSNLSNLSTLVYPQPGGAGSSSSPYTTNPQNQSNSYATLPNTETGPSNFRIPQPSGADLPITQKRPLPLSYILAALVLVACLVIAGMRFLPGLIDGSGNNSGGPG